MALLDSVRDFCGLTTDFDTEITELIAECKADLQRVGILSDNISDTDSNIITACKLYSAWMRDISNKGETYKANYEAFRDALSLAQSYITEEEESDDV